MFKIIAICTFLLFVTSGSRAQRDFAGLGSSGKTWAKHCYLGGISGSDSEARNYYGGLVRRCNAHDACVLACERSRCAVQVGGGCAHMCSSGVTRQRELIERARQYEDRTAYICRWSPNNSFKGKPLRGSP